LTDDDQLINTVTVDSALGPSDHIVIKFSMTSATIQWRLWSDAKQ